MILADRVTIYVAKSIFAGKTIFAGFLLAKAIFATLVFFHGKNWLFLPTGENCQP